MIDPITLLTFLPAALALNLTPGADMMFCLGQGLRGGPRAAWAASAGIALGAFIHAGVAGLGLAALLTAAPWAFEVIRWAGVGYLLWLACQALRSGAVSQDATIPTFRAFRSALVVNLTNPKVALFVLAFVPQFIDPNAGSVLGQFLAFGAVLSAGGLVINGLVGVFAGTVGARLRRGSRALSYVTAGIFAALALRLAVLDRV